MAYTWPELTLYLVLYAFLGWLAEVVCYAVARRRFYNRGLLTMPLVLSHGVTAVLLLILLPTLEDLPRLECYLLQFFACVVIAAVVESLSAFLTRRVTPKVAWAEEAGRLLTGSGKGLLVSALVGGVYYLTYLVVQPFVLMGMELLPPTVQLVAAAVALALMGLDLAVSLAALRSKKPEDYRRYRENSGWRRLADRVSASVWRRLDRAYPGIRDGVEEGEYTFAKGLCLDKLIWVFLAASLVGDLVETLYCRLVEGAWMSRSSVLYGPFSFVWGLGGLLFTVSLQRLAGKSDRYVFLGGFVIGGVFEYACSVFTELVFGTVFWDYSEMPLNIGGRTNVLFCFFWGVVAVVWVKVVYPPLSALIERLPAVAGKVLTWAILVFLVCDAALTAAAMVRYDQRPARPESANAFEAFLDRQYDDEFMARRWPNMIPVAEPEEAGT